MSSHNAPHKRLLRTNHIPFRTYSQSDFSFHFSGSDLLYTHRMVTPPITTLLLSVLHFGMTKQSNWIVDSLCGDVSYFLCCFFFPFLWAAQEMGLCMHAGYGIKTQNGGARASNWPSVFFAVLFKIYETKINDVLYLFIYLIIVIFTLVFTWACTKKHNYWLINHRNNVLLPFFSFIQVSFFER